MDYKAIVKESWELTQSNKGLLWLGSISAFITTIAGIVILIYQITSFQHSALFGGHFDYNELVGQAVTVIQNHTFLSFLLVGISIILLIIYMFVPLIINGALIDLISKIKQNRPLKGGVGKGIMCLFPMVKYHALISPFGLFSILMEISFILRLSGLEIMYFVLPFFILFFLIGFIMIIIFSFADQYIILENSSFIAAMGHSTKLVLVNFRETIFLMLLMLLISVRIFINVILILLVPFLIITVSGYLASIMLAQIGTYIAIGVGVILLFLTAYFIGTLNVFTSAVWTLSFLEMRKEEDVA